MTPVPELNVSAIRSLLAVEREMTPQPEEVRQRALVVPRGLGLRPARLSPYPDPAPPDAGRQSSGCRG